MDSKSSTSIATLALALAKAQGVIRNPRWDAKNPQFNSKYATLGAVLDAIREPLARNELAIVQATRITENNLILDTTLLHSSGEWITSEYPVRPYRQVKGEGWQPADDPQSIGSALSYARRYALSALVGIADDDDDGNAASKPAGQPAQPQAPKPAVKPLAGGLTADARADADKAFDELDNEAPPPPDQAPVSKGQLARIHISAKKLFATPERVVEYRTWLKAT